MKATELLAELRPPLDDPPADDRFETVVLTSPEWSRPPSRSRYRRPLAVAGAAAALGTAAIALVPSGGGAPVGLAGAVAALAEPEVLLHYKVTTRHLPSGATESAESWQTPDGRRARTIAGAGVETVFDQRRRIAETYVADRNEILVDSDPELFADEREPFGAIGTSIGSPPIYAGDLPALLRRALSGQDPRTRHVGRTAVRGIDVDHIRVERDLELADRDLDTSLPPSRTAARRTITIVRDVYVRHDNALPVRVVDHLEGFGNPRSTKDVSDFTDVQKLTLDASTESALRLADHPGAKRTFRAPFDDSVAEEGR